MRPLVLYHGPTCMDGWASCWVTWRFFKDEADYVPVQYGQDPPDVAGRDLYILDFSYKRPVMEQLRKDCAALTVLDHHKSAQDELAPLMVWNVASDKPTTLVFDMDRSGARLAWEHFFTNRQAPWLVKYVEDRDLWRWQLPFSHEVNAALASYPKTFEEWELLNKEDPLGALRREGAAILRYQAQLVESQCQNASEIELAGHKILAVNATCLISEIAGKLADNRPFAATFFIREDNRRVWSLRSREGGVDVSEIARRFGGGGHVHAAGFED